MAIQLGSVSLGGSIPIRVRFLIGRAPRAGGEKILVVKYDGTCRSGADGESDGLYMLAMGKAGVTFWAPDGLVIDLTDLECRELADGLQSLLFFGEEFYGGVENLPEAVVAGPRCEQVIETLYQELNAVTKPEAALRWHRDVEGALDQIEEEMVPLRSSWSGDC